MNCKNCGELLNKNDKFCNHCGQPIKISNQNVSSVNNGDIRENVNFDEKLIKAFIGEKADKMYESVKNGGINIWGILFGIFYFAYRKMYFISSIIVIFASIVSYLVPSIASYIGIFIGLMFCPIYKWDITRKLRKIKKDNPNANENQLLEISKNKGGTSIIGAILFLVVYVLAILFI